MKKKRRALKVFAAILITLVVLVALLPTILSLAPVRAVILKKANAGIDGSLDAESWSLSWFKGPSVRGVAFRDKEGTHARIESITLSARPLDLLKRTKNFGRPFCNWTPTWVACSKA